MRKRLLRRITYLCLHHPRKVLLVFFIIFGLAFFLTGRLRFDPDFLKLFPAEKGPIRLYMENLKETGAFDLLFILLESKEGVDSKGLIESGQTIADKLKEMEVDGEKAFRSIRFQKVEPEDFEKAKPGFTLFLTHPYLFLNEGDIEKLKKKWTEEEIAKQIQKNKKLLVSHASFLMKDLIQTDPFELRWLFMEKWKEGMKGMEFDESSNFFLSKDQKFLLLITEPSRPATDFRFSKSLMIELEKLKSTEQENPIKVYLTGAHPIATAEAKVLRLDMQSSFLISLGLVLILFFYVYRRGITLLIIGLPLLGGIQLTMGIASFTLGSLNILTIAFAAILVGLGIDFAIHLYDRYHQERAWGKDLPSAIEITLTETGSGIWTGAFTTIFAFIILFFSRVRGITELAFLVSTGLFCSLLCIYFVLPSFLVWMDQRKKSYPYSDLKPLSFKRTSTFIERYPLPIFLGLIGVTLLFGLFSIGIEIEKDFRNLRPKEIESMEAFDRMAKAFGGRKWEGISVHEGREIQALLSKEEEWVRILEKYQRDGKIDSFYSLSKLIPSLEKQKKVA
ncbi:MAG: MMPL family transporter, partial [Thermodesulfobacteriota bacterium]